MKSVKLGLVAVLSCCSYLGATPLDEVIKNVDVSGILRYRYYAARTHGNYKVWGGGYDYDVNQGHQWRADIGFKASIDDNFKAVMGFGWSAWDAGYGQDSSVNTSKAYAVNQLYLSYNTADTEIRLGRQVVDSIWSFGTYLTDFYAGLIGTGAKIINNSIDGLTLSAFAFDSLALSRTGLVEIPSNAAGLPAGGGRYFEDNGEIQADVGSWLNRNFYGASAVGNFKLDSGEIRPQLWLGYIPYRAILYAGVLEYNTQIFDTVDYTISGTYLGNAVNDIPKKQGFKNGNFFQLEGSAKISKWNFTVGGIHYGNKNKKTFTVIADQGSLSEPGIAILYTNGARLSGDLGENTFGYIRGGYSFTEKLSVWTQLVYGATRVGKNAGDFWAYSYNSDKKTATAFKLTGQSGRKFEAMGGLSYKYSPKLSFSTWITHLNVDRKGDNDGSIYVGRFQIFYSF